MNRKFIFLFLIISFFLVLSFALKEEFGYFDFKTTVSKDKIELQSNTDTPFIYQDIILEKYPFKNYYKVANYLESIEAYAFSRVEYYNLSITYKSNYYKLL